MNKRLLITSIIAFMAIVVIAVTAVLVTNNQTPLVNEPINNNNDVLLSVNQPDSSVDLDVASNAGYDILAGSGVTLANISEKVLVTDYDGNAVLVTFTDKGNGVFTINAPQGGYIPGAAYSINLSSNLRFIDEAKANSSNWDFIVIKAACENVVYQDNVVVLSPNTFTVESDTVISSMADFAVGTILIIPIAAGFEAYKVESSVNNAGGYDLTVSIPEEEEVFKEIDINGKYTINDGTLVFNEELLLSQLQNSQLILGLSDFLPAISFPRVEINRKEGLVYLDILFVYSNFIPNVESSLSILVSNVIAIDPFLNYQTNPFSFNIGAAMSIETTTTLGIVVGGNFEGQYNAEEIIAKLATLTNQTISENFYRVFSWTYPLGATGLFLSYDLDLVVKISFSGTLDAVTYSSYSYKLGVYYVNNELKAIREKNSSFDLIKLELYGSLETKAGVLNTMSLSFLQIAKISLMLEAGVYLDLYGAAVFNVYNLSETQAGYYLNAGLYYDLSIGAGIEILGFGTSKVVPIASDRYSLLELGSRTLICDYAVEESNGAIDNIIISSKNSLLPNMTVKQFDLVNRTFSYVKVGSEKSTFVLEGIENFTIANGVLTLLDGSADAFEETLLVQYKANKTVTHTITISKNPEFPYITSEAILTFDKSAPTNLEFTIDLIDANLTGISAGTYANGKLTIDWNYLIKLPNGVFEVVFYTSKNAITTWIIIEGTVSLYTIGEGTEANPYQIYTIEQIEELRQVVADGNLFDGVYFQLEDNIDMRGIAFTPIANFQGVLDGKGYKIHNFVINSLGDDTAAGLFAKNSGTIKNLRVDGSVAFMGQKTVTVGLIAGINYGTITDCTTAGSVTVESKTNNLSRTLFYVGGVVGINNGTITNTVATNTVNVNSSSYNALTKSYVAGVAGFNYGTVSECTADINNISEESGWCHKTVLALIANE